MPRLRDTTARVLIAAIGTDMMRFPAVGHPISWAGLCPRLDESAGKRQSTRTRQSAPWLKPTLITAAWEHFLEQNKEQVAKRLIQRLRDLGVVVEVKAA